MTDRSDKLATKYRLELDPAAQLPESPLGMWDTGKGEKYHVPTHMRLAPGTRLSFTYEATGCVHDSVVCAPYTTWLEAAYDAHRLSKGRLAAISAIIRATSRTAAHSCAPYSVDMSYEAGGRVRGQAARIINGCKALAADGLIQLLHYDGHKSYGYSEPASTRLLGVSERLVQLAVARRYTRRPVGYLHDGADLRRVYDKMTEGTKFALLKVAKQVHAEGGVGSHTRHTILYPGRRNASLYTALERRGLVRFVKQLVKNSEYEGSPSRWVYEVPAGSKLLELAFFGDPAFASEMLISAFDTDER